MQAERAPNFDIDTYIATLLSSSPAELHPLIQTLESLYRKKLWYQLTQAVSQFFDHPLSKPYRVDVFQRLVRDIEPRINQLSLAKLGARVSKEITDPTQHLGLLTSLMTRVNKSKHPEAYALLLSTLASAKLIYGDMQGTKTDMDEALKILDDLDGIDPPVNAAYYSVAADYFKAKPDYPAFYKNSLLFLACIDPAKELSQMEQLMRAHDLAIAALLGDTIYNFGELLPHPILDSLNGTEHEWIKNLLFTFNEGDIGGFESLAPLFGREPILQSSYGFLRQKICLMALIESVFKRSVTERGNMTFATIAQETRLPIEEVEHLLMKAMSLSLVRGTLNQPDQIAHLNWVQPRVLSRKQIGEVAQRLDNWISKVADVERYVETIGVGA